jgi:raffinose/stachyose/melibiose transport system permease protein
VSRSRRAPNPARLLSRGSRVIMWSGILLALAVYALFGLVPAVVNTVVSFTDYALYPGAPVNFTGWSNYTAMLTSERPGFIPALVATVVFVTAVTIAQNVIALAVAHRLVRDTRWNGLLRVLVFLPIVLGVTIVGIVWILIFEPSQGPAASLWGLFGAKSSFFGSDTLAMPLVIIVQVWQNVGFSALVFLGGLNSISPELYQAAEIDGVSRWRRLSKITFPLLAPAVTVTTLLALVGSFTTYNLIYVLTQGQHGTMTLGMLSFTAAFTDSNLGYGAALGTVLFVMTFIVALPLMMFLRRRETRLLS